jgi:hypothetical protein
MAHADTVKKYEPLLEYQDGDATDEPKKPNESTSTSTGWKH